MTLVWDDSDSLPDIARAAGITVGALLRTNALTREELRDGQVLRVPRPAGSAASSHTPSPAPPPPSPTLPSPAPADSGDTVDSDIIPEEAAPSADPRQATPPSRALPRAFDPAVQATREVWRGVRGRRRIALTFDAGGENEGVAGLLGFLRDEHCAATFFVTGQFALKNEDVLRQISQAGYPIYNHTMTHPEFTKLPDSRMVAELENADHAIQLAIGRSTKPYWRPPFGDRDKRVLHTTAAAGYQSIYWTLDSLDSVGEKKPPDFILHRILNPPGGGDNPNRYLDGAIILMHVGEPETAAAVPQLIRALRQRGFTLVTLDDILKP